MALEELKDMKQTMIEWLWQNNAEPHQVAAYETLWIIAIYNQSQPIPCPRCHLQDDIVARLEPRESGHADIGLSVCLVCQEKFEYRARSTEVL